MRHNNENHSGVPDMSQMKFSYQPFVDVDEVVDLVAAYNRFPNENIYAEELFVHFKQSAMGWVYPEELEDDYKLFKAAVELIERPRLFVRAWAGHYACSSAKDFRTWMSEISNRVVLTPISVHEKVDQASILVKLLEFKTDKVELGLHNPADLPDFLGIMAREKGIYTVELIKPTLQGVFLIRLRPNTRNTESMWD